MAPVPIYSNQVMVNSDTKGALIPSRAQTTVPASGINVDQFFFKIFPLLFQWDGSILNQGVIDEA